MLLLPRLLHTSTPALFNKAHHGVLGLQRSSARGFADSKGGGDGTIAKIHKYIASLSSEDGGRGGASEAAEGGSTGVLVPSTPEMRHREVLAIPLPRRPLFPGNIMPVSVHNPKLVKELQELKKTGGQAYVGAFLRTSAVAPPGLDAAAQGQSSAASSQQDEGGGASSGTAPAPLVDSDIHQVGTFCQVHHISEMESGTAQLLLLGHRRLRRLNTVAADPLRVAVEHLRDAPYNAADDQLRAITLEIVATLKELLHLHPLYNEQLRSFAAFGGDFHDLSRLADMGASLTSADEAALQAVLEELQVPAKADAVLLLLKKEVELCKLQGEIGKRVEEKISKDQRRYFLMEQLRSIKKELGLEKDDKSALIQRFEERLQPLRGSIPEAIARVIDDEMGKLSGLEQASSEFNVTRNYLDWLTQLPWGKHSDERLDIAHAQQVLDEDHYGLKEVKERVLEFIAVGRLRGSTHGKILCLVGPPGVGKTSVGKSIARALNREYYRFSVGGLSDVAEIKDIPQYKSITAACLVTAGHRRTYVGAMPGKMVQCLKSTGTSNPLVLIDEIDKLGRGYQGDPASALLELLDPEQNSSFLDHYLDVPMDLSKVLFMCTANVLDTIPGPLLDRMEVIRIPGYIADEKLHIARQYLEPQTQRDAGIPAAAASITDDAMHTLIDEYAREAGVRTLKKHLEKIYRKVALQLVQRGLGASAPADSGAAASVEAATASPATQQAEQASGAPPVAAVELDSAEGAAQPSSVSGSHDSLSPGGASSGPQGGQGSELVLEGDPIPVDRGDLKGYLGQPPFTNDRIYHATPAGVVMGLAWTAMGGSTLYVEAACVERGGGGGGGGGDDKQGGGRGGLRTTGQLGEVMRESAGIAHTFARAFGPRVGVPPGWFAGADLHVHVPAGATPKDGPSAGCTIITALLSLALDRPVRPDLAMTGEVTLTGRVLPIGGVKEKTIAARRSGVKTLIFPKANQHDFEELSDAVRAGFDVHFVETYGEIFSLALDYDVEKADFPQAAAAG